MRPNPLIPTRMVTAAPRRRRLLSSRRTYPTRRDRCAGAGALPRGAETAGHGRSDPPEQQVAALVQRRTNSHGLYDVNPEEAERGADQQPDGDQPAAADTDLCEQGERQRPEEAGDARVHRAVAGGVHPDQHQDVQEAAIVRRVADEVRDHDGNAVQRTGRGPTPEAGQHGPPDPIGYGVPSSISGVTFASVSGMPRSAARLSAMASSRRIRP